MLIKWMGAAVDFADPVEVDANPAEVDANPAGEDAKVAEVEELAVAVNYFNNIILNTT
jgi:hypothetical protein